MSDQYTRITCGGSPFETTAPVVGLLFGQHTEKGKNAASAAPSLPPQLEINDADDIPVDLSETAATQVSLHTAVFPKHAVVGWYRATLTDDQPTQADLVLTQKLQAHYQSSLKVAAIEGQQQGQQPPSSETSNSPFVFALLQVPTATPPRDPSADDDASKKVAGVQDDDDDQFPLTLYEVSSNALVALENWTLETSSAERIAVERVVREQPVQQRAQHHAADGSTDSKRSSPFMDQCDQIQLSLQAIQERLAVLRQFLKETQANTSPKKSSISIVRQVQGLLYQLGPVSVVASTAATTSSSINSLDAIRALSGGQAAGEVATSGDPNGHYPPMVLQQLAVLAKTVDTIQSYTEKFRVSHEAPTHHRIAREIRRF